MPDTSDLIPRNRLGEKVSDIRFLLSCLDYMFEATGELMDPEDMAIINRIKRDQQ